MENKYIVVRSNSTSGPFIVERNESAPRVNQWTNADVAGYASTLREAKDIAAEANRGEGNYDYDNPGPYRHGNRVSFDTGRSFRITGATRKQASRYLAKVKRAERAGRRVPHGPHGMTPSEAAIELRWGMRKRKRHVSRKVSRPTRARPSRAPVARRAAPTRIPDLWDETARIYGTIR